MHILLMKIVLLFKRQISSLIFWVSHYQKQTFWFFDEAFDGVGSSVCFPTLNVSGGMIHATSAMTSKS